MLIGFLPFTVESTCVLLLVATIIMKLTVVKDFDTTNGKCGVLVVLSLILTQVSLIVIDEFYDIFSVYVGLFMISVGFHFTCLWLCVMSVNVWWTMKNFRSISDDTSKFKSYCVYATLFTFLMALAVQRIFQHAGFELAVTATLIFSFLTTFILGVAFLFISFVIMLQIGKTINDFEIDQFKEFTDRYEFWAI